MGKGGKEINDPGGEMEVTSQKDKREIGKRLKRKCSEVCGCKVRNTWDILVVM